MFLNNATATDQVDVVPACANEEASTPAHLLTFQFACLILTNATIALGLAANGVSAYLLTRKRIRSTFNNLLLSLAFADASFLFFVAAMELPAWLTSPRRFSYAVAAARAYFTYPMVNISLTWSTYMTVSIAVERYLAVHYPIAHRQAVGLFRHLIYVVSVALLGFLVNVPLFLDWQLCHQNGTYSVQSSELRRSHGYTTYYVKWFRGIATLFLPFLLLVLLNARIFASLKWRNRVQSAIVWRGDAEEEHARVRRQENRLATLLVAIVLMFLVCNLPRILMNVYENVGWEEEEEEEEGDSAAGAAPDWFLVCIQVSHFLLVANSSVNIVLYTWLNPLFREMLMESLTCTKSYAVPPLSQQLQLQQRTTIQLNQSELHRS